MTMLALKIGHSCTNCGECDKILPGVRAEVLRLGSVFANPHNPNVDWEAITEAIQVCEVGAFTLGEI